MREAVVLLAGPCARLNVIEAVEILSPASLFGYPHELAVLHHHCVDDWEEGLVRRKDTCPARHCVALHGISISWFEWRARRNALVFWCRSYPRQVVAGDRSPGSKQESSNTFRTAKAGQSRIRPSRLLLCNQIAIAAHSCHRNPFFERFTLFKPSLCIVLVSISL